MTQESTEKELKSSEFRKEVEKLIKFSIENKMELIVLDELRRQLSNKYKSDKFLIGATHISLKKDIRYMFYAIYDNPNSERIEEQLNKVIKTGDFDE